MVNRFRTHAVLAILLMPAIHLCADEEFKVPDGKLVTVEGIKHYGIYYEKRQAAQQLALSWFDEQLKK